MPHVPHFGVEFATSLEPLLGWVDSVHSLISLIYCLLCLGLPGVFLLSDFLNEICACICGMWDTGRLFK
jgi:hypothetical protein